MGYIKYITNRAKERSTWLGLIAILSGVGITLQPDMRDAVVSLGAAIGGFIAVMTKDK
jgi:hypothetical protein